MNRTSMDRSGMPRRRAWVLSLVGVSSLALAGAIVPGALFAPTWADHGISTTAQVAMRGTPSNSAVSYGNIPSGVSPKYLCWTRGTSVGGLNVWFLVNYKGHTGFIPSRYDNSKYANASDIPGKYGIPTCSTSGHGISTTAAVTMRGTPHNADANQGSVPKSVSSTYRCWIRGDSVGGLNVWFLTTYGGRTGFIPSHYDNSKYANASDIPSKYGIPSCGATGTTPVSIGQYAATTPPPTTGTLWSWVPSPFVCTSWGKGTGTNNCISGTGFKPTTSYWGQDTNARGNCTNYVAFRLSRNGATRVKPIAGDSHNAAAWKNRVTNQFGASRVNHTPKVGAIAYWGAYQGGNGKDGHIAYIEKVSGSTIYLTESGYNYGSRRRTLSTGDARYPAYFLHIKDKP